MKRDDPDGDRGGEGDAESVHDLVTDLHEHLVATEELPVRPEASPWLGEAEAVARDLATDADVSPAVLRERVGHVRDLLAEVEATGNEAADEHVTAARRLADEVLQAVGE